MTLVLTKRAVKGSALTATEHDANMTAIENAVNATPTGTDANAIHVATAGEIAGLTTKTTPVSGDFLVIEDSAAGNGKKKITVGSLPAGTGASGVSSFNGRTGTVSPASGDYAVAQVTGAAPLASPTLTGTPAAPTAVAGTNTTQVATTAFVAAAEASDLHVNLGGEINALATKTTPVSADVLVIEDSAASFGKKKITVGSLPAGTGASGVSSFNGRTGTVVPASGDYAVAQVTGAAPLASPTLTGTPAAPTAAAGTNTTQVATTAFVTAAEASDLHVNIGGEINNLTVKPTPVSADVLVIEDSAATFGKKKITVGSLPSAPVASVFGRTGLVAAVSGDYTSTLITGTAGRTNFAPASANVESNLVAIDTRLGQMEVEELEGLIEAPVVKTYPLIGKAKYASTLNSFYVKTGGGSLTYKVQVGGADVTGLGTTAAPLSATTTAAEPTASAAVAAAARVTLVVLSVGSPTDLEFVLQTTRS